MNLHLDFETRSAAVLGGPQGVGAWAYAQHPSTEILCLGYAFDRDSIKVIEGNHVGYKRAYDAENLMMFAGDQETIFSAHNAPFEYAIWECIMHKRYGWPSMEDPKRWSCTLARAAMVGLPLDLDTLGRVLQIKTPKDLEGRRIMQQLCKPIGYDGLGDPIYDEDPAKLARLYAYNRTDVMAEMEVDALLPQMPESERRIWELDLTANRRGVAVDLDMCRKAGAIAEKLTNDLNSKLRVLTNGAIDKATQTTALKVYLKAQGVEVPTKMDGDEEKETVDKAAILELLDRPDVPEIVRKVIIIRQQVGKSSTAKYKKAITCAGADGRVRGVLQYHAAHTGRWGGRLIQPQNYPKGFKPAAQAKAVEMILSGDAEMLDLVYGERSMDTLSDALRGTIVAGPGKTFVSADFNAIEARVLFWYAQEFEALESYRRGESPYLDMANAIYNRKDITKEGDPKEYDLGKRTVLGAGFGMGAPKFKLTAKIQANIDISDELAQLAIDTYREKYPLVVRMWYAMQAAAINAVKDPTSIQNACGGKVLWGMSKDRRFLVCKLPSGRFLWYWKPSVRVLPPQPPTMGTDKKTGKEVVLKKGLPEREELCYWGEHPKTKAWCMLKTYGGALVENVVQATARDLMANGMLKCEAAGFDLLLTVHDELLAEIHEDMTLAGSYDTGTALSNFMKTMCDIPVWAAGCPVKAEGWIGSRYHK